MNGFYRTNICWKCEKATGRNGGCNWQRSFQPVPGWTAERVDYEVNGFITDGYYISACPEFVQDTDDECTVFLTESEMYLRDAKTEEDYYY